MTSAELGNREKSPHQHSLPPMSAPRRSEAAEVRHGSAASLAEANRTLIGTIAVAEATLEALAEQGETLERTHAKVAQLNADVDRANWVLRGMSSVSGWLFNSWFSKPPSAPAPAPAGVAPPPAKRMSAAPAPAPSAPSPTHAAVPAPAPRKSQYATADAAAVDGRIDASLDDLLAGVKQLGVASKATGDALDSQNALLEDISTLSDKGKDKLKAARSTERKLIRG